MLNNLKPKEGPKELQIGTTGAPDAFSICATSIGDRHWVISSVSSLKFDSEFRKLFGVHSPYYSFC